jgi:arylesterase/paraoxonase
MLLGGGNIGYCDRRGCNIAYNSGLNGPNGLVRGKDGLIYVPNIIDANVQVFALTEDHLLRKLHTLSTLPIDNMSVDGEGDIYCAAFPQCHMWLKSSKDPFNINPPSAVVKISRTGKSYQGKGRDANIESRNENDYVVEKVFEDDTGVLPGSTVVVRDSKTGSFFLGGAVSPYITICSKLA